MATVVNARDVLLQGSATRVATVTMAPNLVVDQSQVSGLGILVAGTKVVSLTATDQVFKVPTVGAVTPLSTTLTGTWFNVTTPPTLTVVSGTISPAPVMVNGVVTINAADLTTSSAKLRLSTVDSGVTYTDEITLYKVVEGDTALTALQTNEIVWMTSDYLGNAISYAGCNGTYKVYQGLNDITTLCTFSLAPAGNPSGLTYVLNPATGVWSITGGMPVATDSTTLTLRATFGATTVDKAITLTKTKAAPPAQRGSRTWYVALTGTTAVYSDTLATTTAAQDGGPILTDTVTQYNNSQNFSQTKFWDGSAWQVVNAVVDGNLLVSGSIGATKMAANSIETYALKAGAVDATKITVTTLAAIQASLGTAQIDAAGYLRTAGATAFGTGAGIWMGYDTTTYKFRVGNPAGANISWDGTGLTVQGDITGSTGTFGGSLNAGGGLFTVNGSTGAVVIKSASTGQRLEISNNVLKVFDSGGALRVQLGDLLA
jgi:hypothetical protein